MSDKPMSKYAAKLEARRKAGLGKTLAAIDFAVRITERQVEPPKASASLKVGTLPEIRTPHPTAPRKKHELADISQLRDDCATMLETAATSLECAKEYAAKMVEASASGLQSAEPRGIWQFCISTGLKVEAMAKRAKSIPSGKAAE